MANSNFRNKDSESVHHITSRIAHRIYFLEDEERNDLIDIVRKAAEFCGIKLLGWCIMTNHFHLLLYLPTRVEVDEDEVLRRYGVLKGKSAAKAMGEVLAEWHAAGDAGEMLAKDWLEQQRRRMYDVGSYMKIVKQWFTEDYNQRKAHKGTLWESVYHDRVVKRSPTDMGVCLAYIHLNPIRAGVCDKFDRYVWSSYCAYKRRDAVARAGIHFVYGDEGGDEISDRDIASRHEKLLERLLEEEKLRRAVEIARRRALGYKTPTDPLTEEALVVQAAAKIEKIKEMSIKLREEYEQAKTHEARRSALEAGVVSLLSTHRAVDAEHIALELGVSARTARRILRDMKSRGLVEKAGREEGWQLLSI